MTHVFHRHLKTDYPTAVKGDGVYIIDANGKRYLDGSCGAAVSCLGHSNREVRDEITRQVNQLEYAHTSFFTTAPAEKLADFLVSKAPKGLDYVYLVSGGSEAMEASIKMAVQYFQEIGKKAKTKIIARWQSYHGNTLGALSAGGNKLRRAQFADLLIDMHHISPCYEYRGRAGNETAEQYGLRVANELEEKILELGAENVAAFLAEPVVGATLGCVAPVKGYFRRIREICDKYEVLLVLDEVMCGMGRTGTLFAIEQEGITGDLIAIAKGLGAGYQPIGAVLVAGKIHAAIKQGSGFFQHGHTYLGHPVACAASLKVQEIIQRDNLLANVKEMGGLLMKELKAELGNHENIGDIRGRGLFVGLEFVQRKKEKSPFDPALKINAKIKAKALENGLAVYAMGGTVDGKNGDHLMLAPPFIIEAKHVDEIVTKLSQSINEVLKSA
jgi:adenosylmethionine-8-amino-7-oxononanoate aminotransferase